MYGLLGATGNKRELAEYMVERHGEYIRTLNNNISLQYAVRNWNTETKNKFVKELKKVIGSASYDKSRSMKKVEKLKNDLKYAK